MYYLNAVRISVRVWVNSKKKTTVVYASSVNMLEVQENSTIIQNGHRGNLGTIPPYLSVPTIYFSLHKNCNCRIAINCSNSQDITKKKVTNKNNLDIN